jgi:hypothetical protein
MTIIFYLITTAPLVLLFAASYFPLVGVGRWLTKRKPFGVADAFAPFAGLLGTALAFLFFGLLGLDRFALVSEHVRTAWESSGYVYEMAQGLFSGGLCALLLASITPFVPRLARTPGITTPAAAVLVSFIAFSLWPVLCSPFI